MLLPKVVERMQGRVILVVMVNLEVLKCYVDTNVHEYTHGQ